MPHETRHIEYRAGHHYVLGRRPLVARREVEFHDQRGSPERTHPVHGAHTSSDRWTYKRPGQGLVDLYFTDGVLTQIGP